MYYQGSTPAQVMRTGSIAPFDPRRARQDIEPKNVGVATQATVGQEPGTVLLGTPVQLGAASAKLFQLPFPVTKEQAAAIVARLKAVAVTARFNQLTLPRIVGGPISVLAKGGAVVLRWTNGVAMKVTL